MEKLNGKSLDLYQYQLLNVIEESSGPVKLMLHDIQHEMGYIPFNAMVKIADTCGVSVLRCMVWLLFYTQFTTQPKGKHVVNVCMGTACYVKGAQKLLKRFVRLPIVR